MMSLNGIVPEDDTSDLADRMRSIRRIGGSVTDARYGGSAMTSAARKSFLAAFEREVDPDGILAPEERLKRAESARRAHMSRIALKRHKH